MSAIPLSSYPRTRKAKVKSQAVSLVWSARMIMFGIVTYATFLGSSTYANIHVRQITVERLATQARTERLSMQMAGLRNELASLTALTAVEEWAASHDFAVELAQAETGENHAPPNVR